MSGERIVGLALRSMAAGESAEVTVRAVVRALSRAVPRCVVGVGLRAELLETARAGSSFDLPASEYLRLVSTGRLPYDPMNLPAAHQNRWVEPLLGFLDPGRYASSPVGRFMARHGVFYFGRHFVCDEGRIQATVVAWLPQGVDRFTGEEVSVLSSSATALGPLLRLYALASLGASFEAAAMQEAERRGQAAFLVGATGAVVASSAAGQELLRARPTLRAHIERIGSDSGGAPAERTFPALKVRLTVTAIPTARRAHRLVTATPLGGDGAGSLTSRQRELLDYVENGLNNHQIGLVMGLSPATVKTMLQRLYQRTGTSGRMELVGWRRAESGA
jgi:DNA-binding NarL/FixJ family response regulator